MDYRHPIKQIANRWIARFRDTVESYDDPIDLISLERHINSAIQEIIAEGYTVYGDGSNLAICGICITETENNKINIEFIPYD